MASSVLGLLADLHHGCLLRLTASADQHFQGLAMAGARVLPGKQHRAIRKKLRAVESALAICRHISPASNRKFLSEIDMAIQSQQQAVADNGAHGKILIYDIGDGDLDDTSECGLRTPSPWDSPGGLPDIPAFPLLRGAPIMRDAECQCTVAVHERGVQPDICGVADATQQCRPRMRTAVVQCGASGGFAASVPEPVPELGAPSHYGLLGKDTGCSGDRMLRDAGIDMRRAIFSCAHSCGSGGIDPPIDSAHGGSGTRVDAMIFGDTEGDHTHSDYGPGPGTRAGPSVVSGIQERAYGMLDKPVPGYDYLATAAFLAAESSPTGADMNVCITDALTEPVPVPGYDCLTTAAHLAAESSSIGADVNIGITDAFTEPKPVRGYDYLAAAASLAAESSSTGAGVNACIADAFTEPVPVPGYDCLATAAHLAAESSSFSADVNVGIGSTPVPGYDYLATVASLAAESSFTGADVNVVCIADAFTEPVPVPGYDCLATATSLAAESSSIGADGDLGDGAITDPKLGLQPCAFGERQHWADIESDSDVPYGDLWDDGGRLSVGASASRASSPRSSTATAPCPPSATPSALDTYKESYDEWERRHIRESRKKNGPARIPPALRPMFYQLHIERA